MKVRIKSANSVRCPKCGTLMSAKWFEYKCSNHMKMSQEISVLIVMGMKLKFILNIFIFLTMTILL